ncbi:MAG: flagellar hook-basal body complex protein, partial [bacterium]|nr:flagellar hook-basal body complex protein [bacterium]
MNTAFYSALSGLSSYAGALNVVGNNLANINTSGFKTSEVSFEDLVTRTFNGVATNGAGNPLQIGLGALTNSISGIFSQGSIKSTSDATNVAIEGNGFFVVGDGATEQFYTRAGNFFLNDDGILVNPAGKSVLGYTTMDANNEIQASGALTEINLAANQTAGPEESTWIDIFANLDVRAADDSTFAASTTFYDSKGAPHVMTATFTHNGPAVQDPGNGNDWWSVVVEIPGEDVGQLAGTTYDMLGALTEIEFDGTGTLIAPADVANAGELDLTVVGFANGADDIAAGELTWRLYDPDDGTPQLTGYPLPSSVTSTN